jgi:phage shock protein C
MLERMENTKFNVHETLRREGLVRPRDGRVLGGVASGLGRRLGLDPWPSRILFGAALLAIPGSQILVYPVLWALMPEEKEPATEPAPKAA